MILTLSGEPEVVFSGPEIAGLSQWQVAAGGESPSLTITLDPAAGAPARLDPPPLRAAATLEDDAGYLFVGLVKSVTLGASATITLET